MKNFLLSLIAVGLLAGAASAQRVQRIVIRNQGFRHHNAANVQVFAPGVAVQSFGGFRRSNVIVNSGFAPNAVFAPQFVAPPVVIQSQPSVFVAPTAIYSVQPQFQSFGVNNIGVRVQSFGGCY